MQDEDKGELNNKDLGLKLEINGDLRLSNRGLMKKSGSLGGVVAPATPPLDPPLATSICYQFQGDRPFLTEMETIGKVKP